MYPARELTQLAAHKTALQRDITLHRAQCAAAAARVVRPLEWLDWTLAFCRRHSPLAQFAAVVAGLFVKRTVFPRLKLAGSLLRWGPLVVGAVRLVNATVMTRVGTTDSSDDRGRGRGSRPGENGSAGVGAPPGERGRWQ